MSPTFLVTGCNGQVGFELVRSLAPLGPVIPMDRAVCELSRPDDIRRLVRQHRPDVIVNAAAYTDVDKAETDAEAAFAVNGVAPGVLAEEAARIGALMVHYSTDCVFDGAKEAPYLETDAVNPQSVYGTSKAMGEQAVLAAAGGTSLILRVSWVAGAHGENFAKAILRIARKQPSLRVVADQIGAPTTAALIADVTAHIVSRRWISGDRRSFPGGIYHLTAGGETSWHGYAAELLRHAATLGAVLMAGPGSVEAIATSEYPSVARRPSNARLDTARLRQTFDIHLPEWQRGIHWLTGQILG